MATVELMEKGRNFREDMKSSRDTLKWNPEKWWGPLSKEQLSSFGKKAVFAFLPQN